MHEHWLNKKKRSELDVQPRHRPPVRRSAGRNGARGGKLVGAGAGGFLMFYAEDPRRLRAGDARGGARRAAVRLRPRRQRRAGPRVAAPSCSASILAGGLGHPDAAGGATVPKTLLPVAGRPFADWQLELAGRRRRRRRSSTASASSATRCATTSATARGGASRSPTSTRATSCAAPAGALAAGARPGRAGRAVPGAVRRLLAAGRPRRGVAGASRASGLPALMTVSENDGRWDASNVVFADGHGRPLREGAGPAPAGDALDRLRPVGAGPRRRREPGHRRASVARPRAAAAPRCRRGQARRVPGRPSGSTRSAPRGPGRGHRVLTGQG